MSDPDFFEAADRASEEVDRQIQAAFDAEQEMAAALSFLCPKCGADHDSEPADPDYGL